MSAGDRFRRSRRMAGRREQRPVAHVLLQRVMLVSPTTHFVAFVKSVVFRGAGFDLVWPNLAAILAIGAVAFTAALARFRKTVSLTRL